MITKIITVLLIIRMRRKIHFSVSELNMRHSGKQNAYITANNQVVNKSRLSLPDIKSKPEMMLTLCGDGLMLDVSDGLNILQPTI